jgi:hypothetical protein
VDAAILKTLHAAHLKGYFSEFVLIYLVKLSTLGGEKIIISHAK